MPGEKSLDFEYIEVKVSKKLEIRLSPEELVALAQDKVDTVKEAPRQAAGRMAQLGQKVKDVVLGRPKDPG